MNKSSKKHITKAHDHFFRMAMSDKRVAREFFEVHLPEDLCKVVDLNHLELQSGTYIDDMRQESIADMLFKTMIDGHETYLYLVVDHQSQPDELMPFRCLKYTCNFIDQHLKSNKTKSLRLPLVVPIVVYHGKQSWLYSTHINDLVDAPKNLVESYFLQSFQLIDLTLIQDEALKQRAWAGAMELTLKHIFARDMLPYVRDIIELLERLEKANGKDFAEIVLIYILDRAEMSNKDTFIDMIKTGLSPEVGGKIVTIAEQFKAEGIQQGIQQGVQQGIQQGVQQGIQQGVQQGIQQGIHEGLQKAAIVLNRLAQGVDVKTIAKETGLMVEEIELLKPTKNH